LSLGANSLRYELAVHALGWKTGPANLAGMVGYDKRAYDEVSNFNGSYVGADLLHDADVLVAHRSRCRNRLDAAVGPQVGSAHARRCHPDNRVCRVEDLRVFTLLEAHIAGRVQDSSSHRSS